MQLRLGTGEIVAVHPILQRPFGALDIVHATMHGAVLFEKAFRPVGIRGSLRWRRQGVESIEQTLGEQAQQRQLLGRQGDALPGGLDVPSFPVDHQLRRLEGALGRGHGFRESGLAYFQMFVQAMTQAHERDLGQFDHRLAGIRQLVVAGGDDPGIGGGVEEVPARLEGLADQDVREPVLRPAEQGKRITQVEAHGLSPTGDGGMQGTVVVTGQFTNHLGDLIRQPFVVLGGTDVLQCLTVGALGGTDLLCGEADRRQSVIRAQAVEPARLLREQGQLRPLPALGGGE